MFQPFWHVKLDLADVAEVMDKIFSTFCWVSISMLSKVVNIRSSIFAELLSNMQVIIWLHIYSLWMWVYWTLYFDIQKIYK